MLRNQSLCGSQAELWNFIPQFSSLSQRSFRLLNECNVKLVGIVLFTQKKIYYCRLENTWRWCLSPDWYRANIKQTNVCWVPCRFSHRPRFHLQKQVLNLNGKTSGNENERRGLQTFSVRSDADQLRAVCGRTSRARPWFPSSTAHRRISDNKPRMPWRCFAWWHKFARCVLLPSRRYAYRRRRISDDPTTEWARTPSIAESPAPPTQLDSHWSWSNLFSAYNRWRPPPSSCGRSTGPTPSLATSNNLGDGSKRASFAPPTLF